uniref:F-box only protein 21-like isoform X2 n=1 Tax=Hirondellea gigas TaxID=1518452 RepID=A0A6A7FX20_9CRUS
MVLLSAGDALMLVLLLTCVPIQMWLYHKSDTSAVTRDGRVMSLIRELHKTISQYLSPHYWTKVMLSPYLASQTLDPDILEYARLSYEQLSKTPSLEGECPAVEVIRHLHPLGHFARGVQQRRYRTRLVQYKVGQVVKHTEYGVKGVIIGWDETCLAPRDFIRQSYSTEDVVEVCETANYAVLLDTNDYPHPITHYFAQKYIVPITNTKVEHPSLDRFFDKFDGSRYLPTSWLAAIYPED